MFSHLLKPKWQHTDPRKRQAALESGNLAPEVLTKIIREDADDDVRCSAIQCLEDPNLLAALLQSNLNDQFHELILKRQRELLARPLELAPTLEQRLAIIEKLESMDLCEYLAAHAIVVEVRTAALDWVTDTQLLCTVAVDDPIASVRRKALDRITEPDGWKIVSRNARNKDKKISRIARERFEAYHQALADRASAEQLCREMDDLLATDNLTTDSKALYQRLCNQWQQMVSPPPPQLNEQFNRAQQQVLTKIEQFDAIIAERRAICDELDTLLEQMRQHQEDDPVSSEALEKQIRTIDQHWQSVDPNRYSNNPVTQRYAQLHQQLRQDLDQLNRDRLRADKLRAFFRSAGALLQDPIKLKDSQIKQLQLRWNKLEKPESRHLSQSLQNEFDGVLHGLREHIKQQLNLRKHALEEAETLLPELQAAYKRGELEQALSLRDRIIHRLKHSKGISQKRHDAVQMQLNQMRVELDELKQWRHWGSEHARDHLITEIEQMIGSSLNPDEIAAKVRSARKAWQRIDLAEGPTDENLWQRFDKACTNAYEPYQQARKKQQKTLNQHLSQKEKLYAELDAFERNTDWAHVDWPEAEQYIHKAHQHWRRIGSVPHKAGKPLEKNFRAVLERLDSHLAPERNRELRRRRALIAHIETLTSASDLRAASREVKDAQTKWKPTVALPRNEEQVLWKQFRTACDAVFNQLKTERESADAERQTNLERKQAICAELEALFDKPEMSYREIHKCIATCDDEWSEIRDIPRKQERTIDTRYEAIKKHLAERQRQEKKATADARLESIRAYSQLCACLEDEALNQTMDEDAQQALLAQSSQHWQNLPVLDAEDAKPLQARYELASRALQQDSKAQQSLHDALATNLALRLQICLQLEVESGIDSPAEYADERMKYQVSMLTDALQKRHVEQHNREDRLAQLEIAWLLAGPVEQQERKELTARFERAVSVKA